MYSWECPITNTLVQFNRSSQVDEFLEKWLTSEFKQVAPAKLFAIQDTNEQIKELKVQFANQLPIEDAILRAFKVALAAKEAKENEAMLNGEAINSQILQVIKQTILL